MDYMDLPDVLRTLGLKKNECRFFYMNSTERPYEVEILNSTRRGNCDIIRKEEKDGRKGPALFVDLYGLWVKTPKRFMKIRQLLKEVNEID
jgi:hypothetical protein